jgi:tight adherence protein B
VEICERLAALGRAGHPLRRALESVPDRMADPHSAAVAAARRATLGCPLGVCVESLANDFGPDFERFARCIDSAGSGGDWARDLDDVAITIRDRQARERAAAISGAGATLSARTIAFLPFLLLPVALKQLSDPAVAASVASGLVLGYCGYRWLLWIVPAPPSDGLVAGLADEIAASLSAGIALDEALRDASGRRRELRPLVRKVDLGGRWVDLLLDHAPPIGRALEDATATGVPIATSLRRTATEIRREAAQAFERDVERAPIRMVVPLVCCILPSFLLVAIVPLLRGLAQPA